MTIRNPKPEPTVRDLPRETSQETTLSARDRLLAALETAPRLSKEEAERINRVVQAARDASIADPLSA